MKSNKEKQEIRLEGIPASPGIAIGEVFVMGGHMIKVEPRRLREDEVQAEVDKFMLAVAKAKEDLEKLRAQTAITLGEESSKIFEAHQLMLEDELIIDETIRTIRKEKKNADLAFYEVIEKFESSLAGLNDDYMRTRAADLRDIKKRVIRNIQGDRRVYLAQLKKPAIIVARELTPSDTITLDKSKVLGFATDLGAVTSHAAIMARSLKVPSVVALGTACQNLKTGDQAILDANQGLLIIHPTKETIRKYIKISSDYASFERKLSQVKELPARTKDGKDIELAANVEFTEELDNYRDLGADGIGLFRTEYLYLAKSSLPTEEEQYEEYARAIKAVGNHPFILRTFDLGGDKLPESLQLPPEENPFLGMRAIRIYMQYKDLFKTQLRAILRASVYGKVRILFPMISCVSEIRFCRSVLQEVKKELSKNNIPFADDIPIGAMIEVPSAAVVADHIAKECDFLSIGTNDLIQYSLAVDRGNEHVAYLYSSFDPAILRLIRHIIKFGHEESVWVGMCGEMASDPLATMLLIGLGIDELSVSPMFLPLIKEIIRRVDFSECENLADRALSYNTSKEVEAYLKSVLRRRFKDLLLFTQTNHKK